MSKKNSAGAVAVAPATVTATGEFLTVPIGSILIEPERNSRFGVPSVKKIQELKESIITEGMHEPVIVSRVGESGQLRLEAGYCRAQAVQIAVEEGGHNGMVPVHVEAVRGDDPAEEERLLLGVNVSENAQREDFSPMDKAKAISRLSEAGYTLGQIKGKMRLSAAMASQLRRLMELRPQIQNKIHSGELPWTVARELTGMGEADQDAFLAKWQAEREGGGDKSSGGRKGGKAKKAKAEAQELNPARKFISAKKAMVVCEEGITEVKAEAGEKEPTKKQAAVIAALTLFQRLLSGKLGQQAFLRKLLELL